MVTTILALDAGQVAAAELGPLQLLAERRSRCQTRNQPAEQAGRTNSYDHVVFSRRMRSDYRTSDRSRRVERKRAPRCRPGRLRQVPDRNRERGEDETA